MSNTVSNVFGQFATANKNVRLIPDRRIKSNVSRRFLEKLLSCSFFFKKQELIAPCWRLVSKIYNKSVYHLTTGSVELHSETIENLFNGYNISSYTTVRQVLVDMGILEVGRSYLPDEYSKSYGISEEVRQFVAQDTTDFVNMLHNNIDFYRRIREQRQRRQRLFKPTGDIVVDTNLYNIGNLGYRPEDYEQVLASIKDDPGLTQTQRQYAPENVKVSIKRLVTGDYTVIRHEADGRMHNVYNQMHAKMRNFLWISELQQGPTQRFLRLRNQYNIDFRAMHPAFLATYLYPIVPQFVGISLDALSDEVDRWNALWTAEQDPRELLASKWGKTKQWVKRALLVDLNELRNYRTPFKDWMAVEFPVLFRTWRSTEVNQTGCNLSKYYESELLRTPEFYEFAATLEDIRMLCCHDGVSVFAREDDQHALYKAERIRDFLVKVTWRKFGIRPVIKIDEVEPSPQ
jgi:hypothetical protein